MNTWLALVFIGVAPWTPVYGGVSLWLFYNPRRPKF